MTTERFNAAFERAKAAAGGDLTRDAFLAILLDVYEQHAAETCWAPAFAPLGKDLMKRDGQAR